MQKEVKEDLNPKIYRTKATTLYQDIVRSSLEVARAQ